MITSKSRIVISLLFFIITILAGFNVLVTRSNMLLRRECNEHRVGVASMEILQQAEHEASAAEQAVLGRDVSSLEGLGTPKEAPGQILRLRRSEKPYSAILAVPVVGCTTCVADEVSVLSEVARLCGSAIDAFGIVAEAQGLYFWRLMRVARPGFPFLVLSEEEAALVWTALGEEQSPIVVLIDNSTARVVAAFCAKPQLSYRVDRFREFLLRLCSPR